jgi:hypothetical protein
MNKLTKSQRLEIYDLILTEQIKAAPISTTSGGVVVAKDSHQTDKSGKAIPDRPADGVSVTDIGTAYNYTIVVGAAVAVIALAFGVRYINRKFGAAAAARGLSKSQLAGNIIKYRGKKYLYDKVGVNNFVNDLESSLTQMDGPAAKRSGLTKEDTRYLVDELGNIGTKGFQNVANALNVTAKRDYLASAGGTADLETYLNMTGLRATPGGAQTARTWMPILHRVWKGKSGWNLLQPQSGLDDYKLTNFCMRNGVTVNRLISAGKLNIPGIGLNVRVALQQGTQVTIKDWLTKNGGSKAISDIVSNTQINNDIRNLAVNATSNSPGANRLYFPTYKQWAGVQKIGKKNTSPEEYYKQQFSFLIWLNCQ